MDNMSMKSCLIFRSLGNCKCETVTYHFPFVRMAVIQMMGEGKGGVGTKGCTG